MAGLFDDLSWPRAEFLFGAISAATAFVIAMTLMSRTLPQLARPPTGALLNFHPVFRNRHAMAWIVRYAVNT
jgi:hypothetical protein